MSQTKCKYCLGNHSSFNCFSRPRKPIATKSQLKQSGNLRPESPKTRAKRQKTSRQWHKENKPNHQGYYECYLNISPYCLRFITRSELNKEHTESKARRPDLKYDVAKIKSACNPCNEFKGSRSAAELITKGKS